MNTQSPDLYALIIRLVPQQSGTLRATVGHLAHAAFLNILRQVDPALSEKVHNLNGRKPFTLSPLHGYGYGKKGKLHIRSGQPGWLRVTLLDPTLFHTFINYFLQGNHHATIQLDGLAFHVTEILSTPNSHPLAGYDNLTQLYERWQTINRLHDYQTIQLTFRTPTAFSLRNGRFRHMHILPDPPLVFGELAGYWDRLTGNDTQGTIREFTAFNVAVSRHDIQTHALQFPRSKQIGFTGSVDFKVLDKNAAEMIQHLNRLADLAFYTGLVQKPRWVWGNLPMTLIMINVRDLQILSS